MDKPTITSLLKPCSQKKKVSKAADSYLEFFNNNNNGQAEDMRQNASSDLANQYYDLATDFFEYGWGESFHFSTMNKGESFEHAIAKHEYRIALKLGLQPGERVLVSKSEIIVICFYMLDVNCPLVCFRVSLHNMVGDIMSRWI